MLSIYIRATTHWQITKYQVPKNRMQCNLLQYTAYSEVLDSHKETVSYKLNKFYRVHELNPYRLFFVKSFIITQLCFQGFPWLPHSTIMGPFSTKCFSWSQVCHGWGDGGKRSIPQSTGRVGLGFSSLYWHSWFPLILNNSYYS